MQCPSCGIGKLVPDTRDRPYTYKGKSTTIGGVTWHYCNNPDCQEVVMEMGESIRPTQDGMNAAAPKAGMTRAATDSRIAQ
jgi:YgiT-type zinc finger domain-containing protein